MLVVGAFFSWREMGNGVFHCFFFFPFFLLDAGSSIYLSYSILSYPIPFFFFFILPPCSWMSFTDSHSGGDKKVFFFFFFYIFQQLSGGGRISVRGKNENGSFRSFVRSFVRLQLAGSVRCKYRFDDSHERRVTRNHSVTAPAVCHPIIQSFNIGR